MWLWKTSAHFQYLFLLLLKFLADSELLIQPLPVSKTTAIPHNYYNVLPCVTTLADRAELSCIFSNNNLSRQCNEAIYMCCISLALHGPKNAIISAPKAPVKVCITTKVNTIIVPYIDWFKEPFMSFLYSLLRHPYTAF